MEATALPVEVSGARDKAVAATDAPEATEEPGAGVAARQTAPPTVMVAGVGQGERKATRANPVATGAPAGVPDRVRP